MAIKLSESEKQLYINYIKLIASVINSEKPPKLPADFDWELVCRNSQRNGVANIIAYTFDKVNVKPPKTVYNVMENERRFEILKETSQIFDTEKVIQKFEENKIRNIPLKGYFMKHYYPQTDFRSMTDVDIFCERKMYKKIRACFEECGFTENKMRSANELAFTKDLIFVELHFVIDRDQKGYYDKIWDMVKPRDDYNCSYEFSPEDFYVYMLYHASKHIKNGGIGIRMILDFYVYNRAFPNLDYSYIKEQLTELGLLKTHEKITSTAEDWFSGKLEDFDSFGEFVLYCSTFGDSEFHEALTPVGDSSASGVLRHIFRPYYQMKNIYFYLHKFPFLLPFSWVQFWFSRVFVSKDINRSYGTEKKISPEVRQRADEIINELEL